MLLLLTGAGGVGKSTVRALLAEPLEALGVRGVELRDVVPIPPAPDVPWRQRATEQVVRLALHEQRAGRHLLLAGDPVAPGEVLAAPSADRLDGFAVCLLDCEAATQRDRLTHRGDPPSLLDAHVAFADRMRGHARDPGHRPEVITGWDAPEMRWERWADWTAGDPRWNVAEIDTTTLTTDAVAAEVLAWCQRSAAGQAMR